MRLKYHRRPRHGATVAETGLVISALLMLIMGSLDLTVAYMRVTMLTEAARMGARQAIVQGAMAPAGLHSGPWDPNTGTTNSGTYGPVAANTSSPQAQAVAPYLSGMNLANVNVTMQWPNGDATEQSVTVTLSTTWTPVMSYIFGGSTYTLTASSTMPIAH
jgi:Flp pilus assembly protein TadG